MFGIYIPTTIDFTKITKSVIKANDYAVTFTAGRAVTQLRAVQPVGKTGELQSEVGVKFFKQKNQMRGASLRVIGHRYFVSAILENGTRDQRIKARHIFERASIQLESYIESTYTNAFFTELDHLGAGL